MYYKLFQSLALLAQQVTEKTWRLSCWAKRSIPAFVEFTKYSDPSFVSLRTAFGSSEPALSGAKGW